MQPLFILFALCVCGVYSVTIPISITPTATGFNVVIGGQTLTCTSFADAATQISTLQASGSPVISSGDTAAVTMGSKTFNVQYNGASQASSFGSDMSSAASANGGSSGGSSGNSDSSSSGSSGSDSSDSTSGSGTSGEGKSGEGGKGGKGGKGNAFGKYKLKCFPPTATVTTNRGQMNMAEMYDADQNGLEVMTSGGQFSPVAFWLHAEPQMEAEFIRLSTEEGNSLSLTAGHLVFKTECDRLQRQAVRAEKVLPGDCLMVDTGAGQLRPAKVSTVEKFQSIGIFSPVTASGDLLVDNILASCYSEVESTRLQSLMFDYVAAVKSAATQLLPVALNSAIFGSNGAETPVAEVVANFLQLNEKFVA